MLNLSSLDLVRSFIAFVESPNIVEAATKLRISQPLLTKHLQLLEAEVEQPLFYFEGRKKKPNLLGRELYRSMKINLDQLLNAAEQVCLAHAAPEQARLRIGGRLGILERLAEDIEFAGHLSFHPMPGPAVERALLRHELELGVSQYRPDSTEIIAKPFFKNQFYVVWSPRVAAETSSLSEKFVAALCEANFISFGSNEIETFLAYFGVARAPRVSRVFPDWRSVLELVARGKNWSIVPDAYLGGAIKAHKIAVPEKILPSAQFYLQYTREFSKLAWFRDVLKQISP